MRRRNRSLLIAALIFNCVLHHVSLASPVFVPHILSGGTGRNIRHLPCVSRRTGETGICMFAFTCAKANGTHLGTCIDRFYFGSCCKIDDEPDLFPQDNNAIDVDGTLMPSSNTQATTHLLDSNDIPGNVDNPSLKLSTLKPAMSTITGAIIVRTTEADGTIATSMIKTAATTEPTKTKPIKTVTKKPVLNEITTESTKLSTFQTVQNSSHQRPSSLATTTATAPTKKTQKPSQVTEKVKTTATTLTSSSSSSTKPRPSSVNTSTASSSTASSSRPTYSSSTVDKTSSSSSKKPTLTTGPIHERPVVSSLDTTSRPITIGTTKPSFGTSHRNVTDYKTTTAPTIGTSTYAFGDKTTSVTRFPPRNVTTEQVPTFSTGSSTYHQITTTTTTTTSNKNVLTTKKPYTTKKPSRITTKKPISTTLVTKFRPSTNASLGSTVAYNATATSSFASSSSTTFATPSSIIISTLKYSTTTVKPTVSQTVNLLNATTVSIQKKPTNATASSPSKKPSTTGSTAAAATTKKPFNTVTTIKVTNKRPTTSTSTSTTYKKNATTTASSSSTSTTDSKVTNIIKKPTLTTLSPSSSSSSVITTTTTNNRITTVKPTTQKIQASSYETKAPTTVRPTTVSSTTISNKTPTTVSLNATQSAQTTTSPQSTLASTTSQKVNVTLASNATTTPPGIVTWTSVSDEVESATKNPDNTTEVAETTVTDWNPITTPDGWIIIQSPTTKKPETEAPVEIKPIATTSATSTTMTTTQATPITTKPITESTSAQSQTTAGTILQPTTSMDKLTTLATVTVSPEFTESSLTPINMTNYKDVCGRRLFPDARIVGGNGSSFGKWPWQISLRQWRTSTYLHKCGAALLNENWAITAAHCVQNVLPSDLLLRIGEHDLGNEDEPYAFHERRVQIVASHPNFDPRTFEFDLALMRFYEPVLPFQPNVLPICVPDDDEDYVGQTAYVTGWGRLYEDGPLPSVLQEVAVPVINNTVCEGMYRNAGYIEHIPHIFICAGWRKGGFDSCEGDSGGPLVIQRKRDKRWVLAGVISWGIGCAEPNQPGVYTRISEFREWINQILQF